VDVVADRQQCPGGDELGLLVPVEPGEDVRASPPVTSVVRTVLKSLSGAGTKSKLTLVFSFSQSQNGQSSLNG